MLFVFGVVVVVVVADGLYTLSIRFRASNNAWHAATGHQVACAPCMHAGMVGPTPFPRRACFHIPRSDARRNLQTNAHQLYKRKFRPARISNALDPIHHNDTSTFLPYCAVVVYCLLRCVRQQSMIDDVLRFVHMFRSAVCIHAPRIGPRDITARPDKHKTNPSIGVRALKLCKLSTKKRNFYRPVYEKNTSAISATIWFGLVINMLWFLSSSLSDDRMESFARQVVGCFCGGFNT